VKTSQGSKTWSKQAVYGLLSNRVYLGELSYGDPPRFVNENAHEPIVDLATWEAAQHPNGRKLTALRSESGYLLSGIARCSGCRCCLQGTRTSRGKRIYRCTRTRAAGICPTPARVDADKLEQAAVEAFWALTEDLEAEGAADTHGALVAFEDALERAEGRLRQLERPEAADTLGDRFLTVYGEWREKRDQAAQELGHARARTGGAKLPDTHTLRDAWEKMTTQERRELLGLRFHFLAVRSDRRVVVFEPGDFPGELPRRGFKQAPELCPFPNPPRGARVLRL
jgi:Recombinase zinc beta ribbon domain/Recombinase